MGLVAAVTLAALLGGGVAAAAASTPGPTASPAATEAATEAAAQEAKARPTLTPGPTTPTSGTPGLVPADGAFLEGTTTVAATPFTGGDDVTALTVDGAPVAGATPTVGSSRLTFTVGSNSTEARYGSYVLVNGDFRVDLGDAASQVVTLEIPNEHLVTGENTVEVVVGAITTSCGSNHDDFVLSDFGLTLLGEIADGEENEFSYAFGDGSCGSNTSLLLRAGLSFFVLGDPQGTTGLSADVDTTTLANGEHVVEARTASGAATTHTVTVNNAPAGAPRVTPVDGALVNGTQIVTAAAPADGEGGTASLTIDGTEPPTPATLGAAGATFSFDVGSNSIDDAYHNYLLVNGARVELGGDHVNERVDITIPGRLLVPGDNTIAVVTGDYQSSCGVNRDDFAISNLALALDGATVAGHGVQPSYSLGDGNCGSSSAPREIEHTWTIDAPAVHVQPALGAGDATLAFTVGTNSIEARYHSYLLVNGEQIFIDDRNYVSERVEITVPNGLLSPGWNRVDVVTGTFPGSCGQNRDDYSLSAVTLTPAQGTATQAAVLSSYAMGDGNCGSSVNPMTEVDLAFFVDAEARGLRADVDTTRLADGRHEVAATSTTGETATRTLFTDNSAPVVASSSPAAGEVLSSSAPLAVTLEDASGVVSGPDVTLDGAAVALGDLVGPGLTAGEHVLAVSATDGLGNAATREVRFSSAGIPDVPADLAPAVGATDQQGTVTLSATVAEPDGGDVTATFSQAEILTPNQAWSGTSEDVPTTLVVPGEKNLGRTQDLAPGDGKSLAAPAGRDVTYQRFDVQVKGGVEAPVLRWEGTVDPERLASLYAWDVVAGAWDLVGRARGAVEGATVLEAAVDPAAHVDGQQVHVLVTGEDPFADDIEPGDPDRFADPEDYDFSIVHLTDTQYLSEGAVEHDTAEERAVWASAYSGIVDWVAQNAEDRKISYVAHTGDITENNIRPPATPELAQQAVGEFEFSSAQQRVLDDAGVPNGVVAGNHDNQSGRDGTLYNEYFGPDRYAALSQEWEHAEYGGPWREGDNENHYDLFSAGGLDFVVVGLSYGVTRDEAEWADSILKRFSDRNAIVLTHDYLEPSSAPDGRGAAYGGTDGPMLYKTVVEDNPNVFLILAGHRHGVGTNVKPQVGDVGHGVVELLADYQFYTVPAGQVGLGEHYEDPATRLRLGASFFRMLQFDVDRGEMIVDTYSPMLGEFGATEYDEDQKYNGLEDNMVLPVDLTSRTTSFTTDSVVVYDPVSVIGSATAASGSAATVQWAGLQPGTTYAWIVTARSTGGGVTTASPSYFTTAPKK
ncbi:metallophosphoesterase [Antribacter gilvus]|uniref:metallophosphoesterase n=1 Tax=Antribacter gilvus TaxID=2304675 RepID=UPI0013E052DB|nr:metallophosphoesterase [Antribacter gilvus]